jgi:hypothetical protein
MELSERERRLVVAGQGAAAAREARDRTGESLNEIRDAVKAEWRAMKVRAAFADLRTAINEIEALFTGEG